MQPETALSRKMIQRPKGTQDILPAEIPVWQVLEQQARSVMGLAGYQEIRTPIFEATELFERGVGEGTDIVRKEMYTFEKGDRSLTLRPEGTAGVVRAYIENGMSRLPKPVRLFYLGPMFRYERPQAGRQRQFNQFGVELFGLDTPAADAEVILLAMSLFERLGLPDLNLELNNIGCPVCREDFKLALRERVTPFLNEVCETCQERHRTNPLRMLDCKSETCQLVYQREEIAALLEADFTCADCQAHFAELKHILEALEVRYRRNPRLVRGLDYYTRTVFEISSTNLGAQNAVCGGGRYNDLVQELGGEPTPAVGWALGMERLIQLVPTPYTRPLDYYIAHTSAVDALTVETDLSGKPFKKQLAHADKRHAKHVLILGEAELRNDEIILKYMETGDQDRMKLADFLGTLE
jgi:histidyl-tRNA synthetase